MIDLNIQKENVQKNPNDPDAWTALAIALESVGEMDKARYCRERATNLSSHSPAKEKISMTDKVVDKPKASKASCFVRLLSFSLISLAIFIVVISFPFFSRLRGSPETPVSPTSTLPALIITDQSRKLLGTGSVYVFVADSETGVSIPNATIFLRMSNNSVMSGKKTNNAGMAYFNVEYYQNNNIALIDIFAIGRDYSYMLSDYSVNLQKGNSKVLYIQLEKQIVAHSAVTPSPVSTQFGAPTYTPIPTPTLTPLPVIPNPTALLDVAFYEINQQFQNTLKSNIAFNKPKQMEVDETTSIELILNPSMLKSALATQLVDQGDFVTSTADPNMLMGASGENNTIETSQIDITPRMKAVLLPRNTEAFIVTEMHDNAEQVVSSVDTTTWRWSVTAKKEGSQTLELVIYQLVKYDGKEFWHEVETYKANIVVEVTLGDRVKSLDWKWIFATLLIPLAGGLWAWWKNRNKKPDVMQVKIVEEKKSPKRKK